MSYQAITDFLTNPVQIQQDFQNFNNKIEPLNTKSSSSFEDLISFYREMNESPVKESEKAESQSSVQEKPAENQTEKSDESKASQAESKELAEKTDESQKTDENQKSEKTETAYEKPVTSEKSENSEKFALVIDADEKSANPVQKKEIENSSEKKVKTLKKEDSGKKSVQNKKLETKDFARMEELTQVASQNGLAKAEKSEKTDLKSVKDDEKSENSAEVLEIQQNSDNKALETFAADAQKQGGENSHSDYAEGHGESEKKVFTLDKEGKIIVEDLRTEKTSAQENNEVFAPEKKSSLKVSEIKLTDDNTAQITMDVSANAQTDILSLNSQTASANGSNFQAMLSNQIQSNASEFVKAGTLVLKDNNQGTINLILHPDDLGNVKVHLSLDGKTMSAHITVSSKEALQVFKDNSETLREAFIKGGFDVADFEVAYNDGGSSNQNMNFDGQHEQNNFVAHHVYNNINGSAVDFENTVQKNDEFSNYSINIVA